MRRLAFFAAPLVALAGCAHPDAQPDKLASEGLIQETAPVKADAEIIIAAPQSKVWNLLTDVKGWPKWRPDIANTTVQRDPGVGTTFAWSTGGNTIHSTIRLIDPPRTICWTGRLLHIHAIHCWMLSTLPDGRTQVRTRESMDGWLISYFYSSNDLLESDRFWLTRLKQAAES